MTRAERAERARAVEAFDLMCASRPLRPPPGVIADRTCTASRWALVADRKAGVVHDPRPTKTRDKVRPSHSWFEDQDE